MDRWRHLLPFVAVGMFAAATVIVLPLYGIALALGASAATLPKILLFSAVVWAPLGVGAGLLPATFLFKGLRARSGADLGSQRSPKAS